MNERKNICVISMENNTGHLLYIVAHANHVAYCRRNGYTYYEANDFSRYPEHDHPRWYKLNVIWDAMQKYPDMDYYLWIDMDAVFTNMDMTLESIPPSEDAQIIMAKNRPPHHFNSMFDYGYNSGVVMFKNTPLVRRYAEEISSPLIYSLAKAMRDKGINHYYDQDLLTFMGQIGEYRGIITDVPTKTLQTFRWQPSRTEIVEPWQKGDRIFHLVGHKFQDKLKILKEIGYDLSTGEVGING